MTSHNTIYHCSTQELWSKGVAAGSYVHPSLAAEGFIHGSTREEVETTLNLYFANVQELTLLEINVKKVKAEIKWEYVPDRKADFPHIFGELNIDAVTEAKVITKKAGEKWKGFDESLKIDSEFASKLEQGWKRAADRSQAEADKPFDYANDYPSDHYTDEEDDDKQTVVNVQLPSKFAALAEQEVEDDGDDDDDWD